MLPISLYKLRIVQTMLWVLQFDVIDLFIDGYPVALFLKTMLQQCYNYAMIIF